VLVVNLLSLAESTKLLLAETKRSGKNDVSLMALCRSGRCRCCRRRLQKKIPATMAAISSTANGTVIPTIKAVFRCDELYGMNSYYWRSVKPRTRMKKQWADRAPPSLS
jgi:hypothetical protein